MTLDSTHSTRLTRRLESTCCIGVTCRPRSRDKLVFIQITGSEKNQCFARQPRPSSIAPKPRRNHGENGVTSSAPAAAALYPYLSFPIRYCRKGGSLYTAIGKLSYGICRGRIIATGVSSPQPMVQGHPLHHFRPPKRSDVLSVASVFLPRALECDCEMGVE